MTRLTASPNLALRLVLCLLALTLDTATDCAAQNSSLALSGLSTSNYQGQFNAVQSDAAGNLYLLLDQQDGIRILKTDSTATNLLAQIHLGAQGDTGLALALDPSGNIYITGTTTSTSLTSTVGAAFRTHPAPALTPS